jgi:glycosyltransferase involved in cell wall biosynthesis
VSAALNGLDTPDRGVPHTTPGVFLMTNSLETGGTERQFVTLSKALEPAKFAVEIGCLKRYGAFLDGLNGLLEFSPGKNLYKLQSHRTRIALARHFRARGTAIAHSFDFYSNLMLIPAARVAIVPVVIGSYRQLGDLLTPLRFRVQKAMFRCCDKVVCNSRAAANWLLNAGLKEKKVEVIPNGLLEEAFAPTKPAIPRLPGTLRVGMVSRMNDPSKNHTTFLRVATRLASKFPSLEFVLVGDGPLRAGLQRMTETLGLSGRVLFLGDRRDIPAVLAAMDISVLPSSSESLSNVVLESMAAGVPVVATDVGGNPELIQTGVTGSLVPVGDEEGLSTAIEQLLTQPELRNKIGRQARESARANYSVEKVRDQYQQLYLSLLAEKGWKACRGN